MAWTECPRPSLEVSGSLVVPVGRGGGEEYKSLLSPSRVDCRRLKRAPSVCTPPGPRGSSAPLTEEGPSSKFNPLSPPWFFLWCRTKGKGGGEKKEEG